MAPIPHILVVDDDQEIRRLLSRYLSDQGYRVSSAGSRRECDERLATEKFDLMVLDVLLPDGSGLDLCRQLRRAEKPLPVILVTALKEDVDRIIGLEIGADDYIGKPFNPRELLARIRAVLRRSASGAPVDSPVRTAFMFAGLRADVALRSVIDASGQHVELTGAEFELLLAFLDRPGRVLSREQLLDLTQRRDAGPFDRSIDVLMSRLRKKFGEVLNEPLFKTVRNGGYQLATHVEREDGA
jgi:two-component system OmpR family response regulator